MCLYKVTCNSLLNVSVLINFRRCLVDKMIFITGNSIPKNVIFGNNFFVYDILNIFGMLIAFSRIVDKFPKIPLMEIVAGGQPAAEGARRLGWVVFDGDRIILVFLYLEIFPFHRNVGFP